MVDLIDVAILCVMVFFGGVVVGMIITKYKGDGYRG